MTKQMIAAMLLALVAFSGVTIAWADVESDGTSIDSVQAP